MFIFLIKYTLKLIIIKIIIKIFFFISFLYNFEFDCWLSQRLSWTFILFMWFWNRFWIIIKIIINLYFLYVTSKSILNYHKDYHTFIFDFHLFVSNRETETRLLNFSCCVEIDLLAFKLRFLFLYFYQINIEWQVYRM
jgi:hypothetical protein